MYCKKTFNEEVKYVKKIVLFILTFAVLVSSVTSFKLSASTYDDNLISYYADIYDNVSDKYVCENSIFTTTSSQPVVYSLSLFADEGYIDDYTQNEGSISNIKYTENGNTVSLTADDTYAFYLKVNGTPVKKSKVATTNIQNGDIIEWVYDRISNIPTSSSTETIPPTTGAVDSELLALISEPLNKACDWLSRTSEQTPLFAVALGSSGKTVSINFINKALSEAKKLNSESVTSLSQYSIMLSFSGYGLDNSENHRLLSLIFNSDISADTNINDCIYSLIAYDTANYAIPENSANFRETIINSIIGTQRLDGGFGIDRNSNSDVTTTALVLTALSPYQELDQISPVIAKALVYLSNKMNKDGSFTSNYSGKCETTARVIVALNSLNIDYNDKMFYVDKRNNPISALLNLQTQDGGFSEDKGLAADQNSTEVAVLALSAAKKNSNPYILVNAKLLKNNIDGSGSSNSTTFWTGTKLLWGLAIIFALIILVSASLLITKLKSEQKNKDLFKLKKK